MFGGAKNTFGANQATPGFTSFNTPTATNSPFGQSAFNKPATGFGGFGAQQQNPGSVFGAQPQAGAGMFGASTSAQPQQSFGGFGQPQQQTSIFGATSTTGTTSLFGTQQNTAFGAAKPAAFGFGQPQQQQQPSTSLFGQTQPTQPQQTSLFGQTGAQAPGTGLFGSTAPQGGFGAPVNTQNAGTSIAKFQPQQETDTLVKGSTTSYVQTKQQCITFMKEYQEKSLEELRIEDYASNRKGTQPGSTGMFGGQQQQQQQPGVFGQQQMQPNTSLFGQPAAQQTTGLFGSTNNTLGAGTSTFGQTGGFGQQNAVGGLFGKPLTTPATTSSSTFGGFGNTTNTFNKPFGAVTAQPTTGLFGQPQSQAPAFGTTTNTFGAPGGFGQAQPTQPTSLFGQAATASTAAPAFGLGATPAQSSGFNFGSNTTNATAQGGLFGAQKPAFGAQNTFNTMMQPTTSTPGFTGFGQSAGGSLFNNAPKPAQQTGFGGFGQAAPQQAAPSLGFGNNTGGSLFGNTTGQSGGLFGSTNPSVAPGGGLFGGQQNAFGGGNTNLSFGGSFGNTFGQNQQTVMRQQTPQIHQQILSLTSNPYGDSDLFKGLKPSITEDLLRPTNPMAQKALLDAGNNFKVSPGSGSRMKVKPIGVVVSKKSLFDGLEEYDESLDESFSLKTNAKRLIIKPRSSMGAFRTNDESLSSPIVKAREDPKILEKENNAPLETFQNQIPLTSHDDQDTDRRVSWLRTAPSLGIRSRPKIRDGAAVDTTYSQIASSSGEKEPELHQQQSPKEISATSTLLTLNDTFRSMDDTQGEIDISIMGESVEPHPTGIVLRRIGYYTIPSLDEIVEYMDSEGRCIVPNFTVGRRGYGNVYFDEEIDVAGLNLDEICHFRNKEIILYQDDDNKPPVGEGLNRKAQVTLDQIWPYDKNAHEPIKDPIRLEAIGYEAKMRRICEKRGTRFLEYRPETGSCVFKVDHFSKYTLSDSDDEGDAPTDPKKAKMQVLQNGKKLVEGGEVLVIKPPNESMRLKQQESTFYLGQHMGQRSFQPYFPPDEEIDLTNETASSPSAALAKEMRTDSHKLQLMKASFFVDDDYDTRSVMSDVTEGRESPDQMVPSVLSSKSSFVNRMLIPIATTKTIEDTQSLRSTPSIADEAERAPARHQDLVPTQIFKPIGPKSQPLIIRPRVMLFDVSDTTIPISTSILEPVLSKTNNTIPFFNGRKFKVGWSRGNQITVLSTQQGRLLLGGRDEQDTTRSVVKVVQIKTSSWTTQQTSEKFRKSIVDHFRIQLAHDKRIPVEGSECSRLEADGGTDALLGHHKVAQMLAKDTKDQEMQFNASVWSLMHSLWGYIDDTDPKDHSIVMLRRDLLICWIESVVTDSDLLKPSIDYLDRLINLMMCHKVADACELALDNNDMNLSLLMAQSSGGPAIRQLILHQLASWHTVEADNFIDERRLKLLMIVAGIPAVDGPHKQTLNIFEQLDWLKCFAIQLWYMSSPISSVTDALVAYEQNFQQTNFDVAAPLPPYTKQHQSNVKHFDVRFHLLKLFSQRSHPLETLLHPANYTVDLMDFRLAFLMLQVLDTLGYRHISPSCRLKVYSSLAEQLESNGMWQWSIWIYLHVEDQNHREIAIQQLLYRHIRIDGESESDYVDKERFIVEQLMIPEKWIHWAKAVRAGVVENHQLEVKYLLKAHQWTKAHDVMMQHIAPDLVINDQMDVLKSLLERFEETKEIQHWKIQGEILVNFIELNEKFEVLSRNIDEVDIDLFLEQIKPKLSELCSIIKLFPCPTPKHRLCQCEIAKQLAFIIRNFYANSTAYGSQACALMRIALEKLPLPQEFAQQELRHILATFLKEKLTIN